MQTQCPLLYKNTLNTMSFTSVGGLLLLVLAISSITKGENLKVTENNKTSVFVELLRGRDGLPGRDGIQGPSGTPGERGPSGPAGPASGGATYIRWGSLSCHDKKETELVYSGIVGGTRNHEEGGGANYLCMPKYPEYSTSLRYASGIRDHAYIYPVEYHLPLQGGHKHDVPCAVCHVSTRSAIVMIPAKASCPATWTREFYGYIMTEYKGRQNVDIRGRTMFECVDGGMETLPGHQTNNAVVHFHHVEAKCGSEGLPCGTNKYNDHQELNCVVCTK